MRLLHNPTHLCYLLRRTLSTSADMALVEERAFQIVVAYNTFDQGIGVDGGLPWKLPGDLSFFKAITTKTKSTATETAAESAAESAPKSSAEGGSHKKRNALVMGRRTWDSIPPKFRPLPGRLNVVLTRRSSCPHTALGSASSEDVIVCSGLRSALRTLASSPYSTSIETVFIIGGGQIYK